MSRRPRLRPLLLLLLLLLPTCVSRPCCPQRLPELAGAVATVHPLATEAGIAALRAGGNAVDAAIAAALTLGVVDSQNSGIGGGCFLLIRTAEGEVLVIDGRETAPAAATRDMFLRDGEADGELSVKGALAVGVPGSLAAYDFALRRVGRRSLAQALALATFDATRRIFLDEHGKPWPEGHVLVQTDLADSYDALAARGIGWFYGGPFARRLETWMRANGGIATARDFAEYEVRLRTPVRSTYRGYEVLGFPPPSSGGVHVAQILHMLERFDLATLESESPVTRRHVMAEAMKLAFADRAHWLGDPDFVDVPSGLCEGGYCDTLADRIDPTRAIDVAGHGTPPGAAAQHFGKHTTHIAAADAAGNWVALTTTINTSFGSKVVVPGTGVLLNNQMDDFSAQPGVPNAYGLVGAEANSIRAGKRPLSSMSPTIVLQDGRPVLTLGGAGGPTIISQVLQTIVNHIDLGLDLEGAVAAPRIHHQWRPALLRAEERLPAALADALRGFGHEVERRGGLGVTQAVRQREDGSFVAVSDPRIAGDGAGRARSIRP